MYRVLRRGGVLLFDTVSIEQLNNLWVLEYFPYLKERYRACCLSVSQYKQELENAGFSSFRWDARPYDDNQPDGILQRGQYDPEFYLSPMICSTVPAFARVPPLELQLGQAALHRDIQSGKIYDIIAAARDRRDKTDLGDIGFIVAIK
jgi:hypothetical protein